MAEGKARTENMRSSDGNGVSGDRGEETADEAARSQDSAAASSKGAGEGGRVTTPAAGREEAPDLGMSEEDETVAGNMSLIRHLEELRRRIIRSLLAVGVGSCVAYYYIEDILRYITLPTGRLYYLQPAEAFFTYLKIALAAGFLLALPVIFYQLWKFVLPALTIRERTVVGVLVPSSVLLFFAGLAFAFFLALPAAIKFFLGFSTENLQPMFTLHQYFDFVLSFILPFGAVFELPLFIIVFARLGFIGSDFLRRKQRLVIFLAFIVGAIVSPTPDIFNQSMIAVPLIVLYEISYVTVRFIMRK